jgi:ethanolamine ammonia-lyase small subunit
MSELAAGAWAARLRALTPARVGLSRTGASQGLHDQLEFQRAHAQARDAVHAKLGVAALASVLREFGGGPICLQSSARDRAEYLQRPDLGRRLNDASQKLLANEYSGHFDLAIVVADGLSALAIERHAAPLLRALMARLERWRIAPLCIVEQGRVAIGDEIGMTLDARLCLVLIGERPGLSSPDSLGAYITWSPRVGRTDAERNCVSNIRAEGLNYREAAAQISFCLTEGRRRQLTGVGLKDDARLLGDR